MSRCAVVAIGGKGVRLGWREAAPFPSKSLLPINGRPALFWTLTELHRAGIHEVILSGESSALLKAGWTIARSVGYSDASIHLFIDQGLGVHGIPGQIAKLPASYFFVAGHAVVRASHFERMRERALDGSMVYSIFPTTSVGDLATRTVVEFDGRVSGHELFPSLLTDAGRLSPKYVLSFPYLLNDLYVPLIGSHSWSIAETVKDPLWRQSRKYVLSSDVPEFDVPADLDLYRQWLRSHHFGSLISAFAERSRRYDDEPAYTASG